LQSCCNITTTHNEGFHKQDSCASPFQPFNAATAALVSRSISSGINLATDVSLQMPAESQADDTALP